MNVTMASNPITCDPQNHATWKPCIDHLTKYVLEQKFNTTTRAPSGANSNPTRAPRLVLSVIGDSSSFVPKPWLTQVFQLGLIETAKGARDCVILYKGSNEKVSTLVWEAVDDFSVMNNHTSNNIDGNFISLVGIRPEKEGRKHTLDKHCVKEHYFNLKQDSNVDWKLEDYGKFHAEILQSMSKQYVPFVELGVELSIKVPVLVIVAEGDLCTVDHVVEVLQRDIPVLILQGSGKAADLIAECMEDHDSIEAKAPLLFGIFFHLEDFEKIKGCMEVIKNHKHYVNIIDITKHDEAQFSDAVVNSIIRAWANGGKNENERPVKTAMKRRRTDTRNNTNEHKFNLLDKDLYEEENYRGTTPEIVGPDEFRDRTSLTGNGSYVNGVSHPQKRNSIHPVPTTVTLNNINVTGDVKQFMERYQKSLTPASLPLYFYIAYQFIQEMPGNDKIVKIENFQILLKQAIIADRVDYVSVLLQEEKVKFDIKLFPTLYQVIQCGCANDGDCQHVLSILRGATEAAAENLINEKKKNCLKFIQSGRQLAQKFLHYPKQTYKKEDDHDYGKEVYQDLLIWSLFANRPELATLFWVKCEDQLLTAVLSSCLLKKMADKAKSGKDKILYDKLKENSAIFEKRSLDLMSKLYEEDPEVAMELVLTPRTVWDITISPLECAYDNCMLDFIAHSCSQRRLNKIWYKKLGASLWEFWKNGFFCGCRFEKGSKNRFLLFKFIYAPLTRFLVHYVIFLAALVWFSAFLLIELSEYKDIDSIKIYEFLIYLWLLGDILEEYRGILPFYREKVQSKLRDKNIEKAQRRSLKFWITRYFYDFWNTLDFVSYCITIAAILVRFLYKSSTATLSRRCFSLSLFTMYMRFLHALLMSRKLGPKIIMIKEMLKDLFRFIGILFIFMMGVGVLYHANMYPAHIDMFNMSGWTYWRIWKIIYIPYWQIYGELFLDKFEANSTTPCTTIQSEWESNPEVERCNQYDWVLIVIAALYMLISNLLLVNLVIALFSYRFEIVQANSERLWRYWRYEVIMDYRTRVPAPLNLVLRPFMYWAKCMKWCKECCQKEDTSKYQNAIKRMERLQAISASKCIRPENKGI